MIDRIHIIFKKCPMTLDTEDYLYCKLANGELVTIEIEHGGKEFANLHVSKVETVADEVHAWFGFE